MRVLLTNLALAVVLISCDSHESNEINQSQAIEIADDYIQKEMREFRRTREPRVYDLDDTWLVRYQIPEGAVGGAPTVEVHKWSRAVVHAHGSQ